MGEQVAAGSPFKVLKEERETVAGRDFNGLIAQPVRAHA